MQYPRKPQALHRAFQKYICLAYYYTIMIHNIRTNVSIWPRKDSDRWTLLEWDLAIQEIVKVI